MSRKILSPALATVMKIFTAMLLTLCLATPALAASPKLVAITFDDGPSKYTAGLLDELAKRDVQVTFFVLGRNAQAYKATIQRAYEAGHQIASHTYSHPYLPRLGSAEVKSQVSRTAEILDGIIAAGPYMLRPPYGAYNARVLGDIGTPAILWSVDTRDWESRRADAVYSHIVNDTRDGSIILMHDLYPSTIEGALRGIDYLKSEGYELVTVRELLRRRGVTPTAGNTYSAAGNKGTTLPGISEPQISTDYAGGQALVTITADAGAKIYYAVDGQPSSQSQVYSQPLKLSAGSAGTTIRAFAAYDLNGGRSPIAEAKIERPRTPAPQISLENGLASITAAEGAQIYYITGDTGSRLLAPTTASDLYSQPLQLAPGSWLTCSALLPDYLLSEAATVVYSPLGNVFADVTPDSWYFADVDRAVAEGLVSTDNGLFMPNASVKRGELAVVLHRLAGSPEPQSGTDQEPTMPAIQWALEQGILTGCPDGSLQLAAPVTREQLAVILQRSLAEQLPQPANPAATLEDFRDSTKVMGYAKEAVQWALGQGIITGNAEGELNPGGSITRVELASIILRCR